MNDLQARKRTRLSDSGAVTRLPDHEAIYRRLRDQILLGELAPGQAVTIQGMQALTGAGMTPVREALRRLVSEGALDAGENRRMTVPHISMAELEDVAHARRAIESQLASRAAVAISDEEIANLALWDQQINVAISNGEVLSYLLGNFNFHFTIYKAADSETLLKLARSLWLRIGPSLRVCCSSFGDGDYIDHHPQVIDALKQRDPDAAAQAITADIQQGIDFIAERTTDMETNKSHFR